MEEKNDDIDTITKELEKILNFNKIDHKKIILRQKTLKLAHIYCKINNLNNITGNLIELYIKEKFNMNKINSSISCGDLKKNDTNYEIKVSNGGKSNNKFNYVQIRFNHDCEYILTAYYLCKNNLNNNGELFIFKLNKENMKKLVSEFGSYAHGTINKLGKISFDDINKEDNTKEYALRPKYDSKCWKKLLDFRINTIDI